MKKTMLNGLPRAPRRLLAGLCFGVVASLAPPVNAANINILPVKICDDAGANCANNTNQLFLAATNKIWAQAGLTFNYFDFTTTKSSEYLNLDNQAEVDALFLAAPGVAANPLTITMWFVATHFDAFGEVNAIPGNKIVIADSVFTSGRLDTIAHEVGHLLGLLHNDPGVNTDFLMRAGADRVTPTVIGDITPDGTKLDKLTAAQIATALADPKVVPEPATFVTMLGGFGMLALVIRRGKGARV